MMYAVDRKWHGSAAVLAMVYLVLMSVLAMAMAAVAALNVRTAYNHSDVEGARASAETGLRWIGWRLYKLNLPQTDVGTMTDTYVKNTLWPTIKTTIKADLAAMSPAPTVKDDDTTHGLGGMVIGPMTGPDGGKFTLEMWPTPGAERVVQIKATGSARDARRALVMEFLVQKTAPWGVLSTIPIQLGKNTTVDGDVCMAGPQNGNQPPVLSVSDFRYTSATKSDGLTTQVAALQKFFKTNDVGHDNRMVADAATVAALQKSDASLAKVVDYNGDGYIDDYDLFLQYFDTSGNKAVQGAKLGSSLAGTEFGNKAPLDPNLFYSLDQRLKPWNSSDPGSTYFNDGSADVNDQYAKVRGHIRMLETEASLKSRLAANSQGIADVIEGPVIPDGSSSTSGLATPAVDFGATDLTQYALNPSDFKMTDFLSLSGKRSGVTETHPAPAPDAATTFADTGVTAKVTGGVTTGDANGTLDATQISKLQSGGSTLTYTTKTIAGKSVKVLTSVTEIVPYGSTNPRSTVTRPVFSNLTFRNCVINRGTNALFLNCTFDGVTFVDGAYNMAKSTADYANGNNFRFESCTFTGPIAQGDALTNLGHQAEAPSSYTDYTNSWEFTGATGFDLSANSKDSTALATLKQQATIMAPRTNIEMGSFTAPGQATCSFQGVVVAGCFDVRGVADIDGTIIIPTNAGPGNCTLGYFGPDDNATNAGDPDPTMVKNGSSYGRIHIRFNPFRSLPNGITLKVTLLPDTTSWREVTP